MPDLTAWMLKEETDADRLRMAVAEAQADLRRRDTALLKLQGEVKALHLEVAGAREETVQFQGMLRRTEEALGQAQAEILSAAGRHSEVERLQAAIAALEAEAAVLRTAIHLVHSSASWRLSRPIRLVGRLMRLFRQAARRLSAARRRPAAPAAPPAALPSPGDPNEGVIFRPAPAGETPSGAAAGALTLDGLYHLSRSL